MSSPETYCEASPVVGPAGQDIYKAFRQSPYLSNKHSSYFMRRDYFGPQTRIIGMELNPDALRWHELGFEIHTGSQSDPAFWKQFFDSVGPVDLVLDDGGHTYEQQISTVHYCLPHLKDGGMIAIEDTHTSYFKDFGYPSRYSFIEWVKVLIDNINSRFHSVHASGLDYRNSIHSIEAFESIVAFKINRAACISGQARQSLKTPAAPEVLPLSVDHP